MTKTPLTNRLTNEMQSATQAHRVLDFWFHELEEGDWWRVNPELDQRIREEFGDLHTQVAAGMAWPWRRSSRGRLAEIVVLDQFSRQIYRDKPQAFAFDGMAVALAQEMVSLHQDQQLPLRERAFCYLPFMHSESLAIHDSAAHLFGTAGLENTADFERRHRDIIARFGRYPHRNAVLGRASTPEELEFLKQPGSSF
nr:DUF924 domain-containing protein [Oceanococcus sp. HetDA_MAG_MS8]